MSLDGLKIGTVLKAKHDGIFLNLEAMPQYAVVRDILLPRPSTSDILTFVLVFADNHKNLPEPDETYNGSYSRSTVLAWIEINMNIFHRPYDGFSSRLSDVE